MTLNHPTRRGAFLRHDRRAPSRVLDMTLNHLGRDDHGLYRSLGRQLVHSAFAEGTHRRRLRIQQELEEAGYDAIALIGSWVARLKPSTVTTYVAVLRRLVNPEQLPTIELALRGARKRSPLQCLKRALPMTLDIWIRAVTDTRQLDRAALTAIFLWATASRHGDLKAISLKSWGQRDDWTLLEASFGAHKSDIFGQRAVVKWLWWPTRHLQALRTVEQRWATYKEVWRWIKTIDGRLTPHSLRRGAATTLSTHGFAMKDIEKITGHTPSADPELAVRRYVDPHPSQPEALLCARMSAILASPIWEML